MEYEVQATVTLTCEMSLEAESPEAAQKEADGYFDNGANYQNEFFSIRAVNAVEIDTVNEA